MTPEDSTPRELSDSGVDKQPPIDGGRFEIVESPEKQSAIRRGVLVFTKWKRIAIAGVLGGVTGSIAPDVSREYQQWKEPEVPVPAIQNSERLAYGGLASIVTTAALAARGFRRRLTGGVAPSILNDTMPCHADYSKELEAAWEKGFTDRNGPALVTAIRKEAEEPGSFQAFIDELDTGEAMQRREQILFRCIEDRLCMCGCGSGGSLGLLQGKDGAVVVPTARQIAEMIADSYVVKNTDDQMPIVYTKHKLCGADGIACGILQDKDPETMKQEIKDQYGTNQGHEVVRELEQVLRSRGDNRSVSFKQIELDGKDMDGIAEAHPNQVIYVIADEERELNPKHPCLSRGMVLDPLLLGENFELHLKTGIGILLGKHGPGKKPIVICGLGKAGLIGNFQASINAVIGTLPEQQRNDVVFGMATV